MEDKIVELLVFVSFFIACSAQSTYFITPTPDTPCPGGQEHCHTLSQYVHDKHYFNNFPMNTTMEFLPGNHTLNVTIPLGSLTWLTLLGNSSSLPEATSRIVCTWPAGFIFEDINELQISALAFISCGTHDGGALNIASVQHSYISNCTFQNTYASFGGALRVQGSRLSLTENTFQNNHALFGGALLSERGSTLSLTGNIFLGNSAHSGEGGALVVWGSTVSLTGNTFQGNSAYAEGGALVVQHSILSLTDNTFQNNTASLGGALSAQHSSTLSLTDNTFQSNTASLGGALAAQYNSTLSLTDNTFLDNNAYFGGALTVQHNSTVRLTDNTFQNNYAYLGGALSAQKSINLRLIGNKLQNNTAYVGGALLAQDGSTIDLAGNTFQDNYADNVGGAIAAFDSQLAPVEDTTFENNKANYGGGLYACNTEFKGSALFTENSANEGGGSVYAYRSTFWFKNATIANNSARDGGGLLLSGDSKLYIGSGFAVHLTNNHATRTGGAIKVEGSNPYATCTTSLAQAYSVSGSGCFFQLQPNTVNEWIQNSEHLERFVNSLNIKSTIYFANNSAVETGADLYGGFIDRCSLSNISPASDYEGLSPSGYVFNVTTSSENTPDISSDPLHFCTCRDVLSAANCNDSYHSKPVYPGGTIEVPVTALGQRNIPTTASIQVVHTSENMYVSSLEYSQDISKGCNTLKYTIHSHVVGSTQKLTLHANGPCSLGQTVTVTVDIRQCPPGFQLPVNEPSCICAKRLQEYTNTCLIDDTTVFRRQDAEFWVGYNTGNDNESTGLILHPHCPFDYCTSEEMYLAVADSDKQCNYNRRGLLCGRCNENMSLVLGSSRCLQCSNSYLSLLAAFSFAGIVLILLLLVFRLTVAAGTINGLIFYANVVSMNSATFFKPTPTNVLTVFIAWLNLDLGIETCFYNGLNAYVKTWLQFAFPLYVWALVGVIIAVSHYSGRVARALGSNPVAVLATLFLLSYAKLLRTIIAVLSYTTVEYPNSQIAVWLYDANVRYLSSKHIPLFAAALVCLIFLFLPYTMLLIFGQWFQAKSEFKVFSCVNSRYVKPFLDAYHAPYSNKQRYWTGLMLLLRFFLFLISAVNALGDPRINLLAVGIAASVILPTILGTGVYKSQYLGLLETSFLLNLAILALTALYIYPNNQNAVTFTSVGIAFGIFIGTVAYHSIQQIKDTRLWRRVFLRHDYMQVPLDEVDLGPEDPPDHVYVSGSAPTQTVVDLHELREPCMATD